MIRAGDDTATHPVQIDVYVDGSYLTRGRHNPEATGGWGAFITGTDGTTFELSGAVQNSPNKHMRSEIMAVVGGLTFLQGIFQNAIAAKASAAIPEIILHTDVTNLAGMIRRMRDNGGKLPERHGLEFMRDEISQLASMVDAMNVKLEYTPHDKTPSGAGHSVHNNGMAMAHSLAKKAAWHERLRQQGFIHTHSSGEQKGEEAERYIEAMEVPLATRAR